MSSDRKQLLRIALEHAMWPVGMHRCDCPCGLTFDNVTWHDDVIRTDIQLQHPGHTSYVIAYPADVDMASGGVQFRRKRIPQRDLIWLLEQPNLPDEFRRAAAVHLKS